MARILAIYYSQTGQLRKVVASIAAPLEAVANTEITWHQVASQPAYPFPWKFLSFLDAFPESVYLDPPAVNGAGFDPDASYDLVILAYQVWFLAPSLPITGFLRSPAARVLKGKPVITVIGCRNMWVTAHRAMQRELDALGARVTDNVVLTDNGPFWSTFITTPWWLLTGNQGPHFGVLPKAGISDHDIAHAARFGRALVVALPRIAAGNPGPHLQGLQAVRVNPLTMLGERIAHRSFRIWGRLVRWAGKPGARARKPILLVYVVFLIGAIVFMLPITMTIAALAARLSTRVVARARALELPSGSSGERLALYDTP